MSQIERFTVETDHVTVAKLIWRRFRKPMPGLVEKVLDMNPGLAAAGPILPVGTSFIVPIPAPPAPAAVRLW